MSFLARTNRNFAESIFNVNYILDEAVEWISEILSPEDVFSKDDLERWALNNGFIREE